MLVTISNNRKEAAKNNPTSWNNSNADKSSILFSVDTWLIDLTGGNGLC